MDQRANEPLVSVVTPVYNGADYLRECIDSLLNQTYQNWEYTIVDNCSTDATHDIAAEYAARDPRIRVHRNPSFVGVCLNHNNAMRQVSPQSKYCKILAADDWLFPECLEKMVALAEQHPSVGLIGAYTLCDRDVMPVGLPHPSTVVPGHELCRKFVLKSIGQPFGLPTSSNMFRSDLVRARQPFYSEADESSMAFDQEACLDVLAEHDFGFVHQVLTFMRVHDETLSSTHANRVNTYLYANLSEAQKYGPLYLSPEELAGRIKVCLHNYYSLSRQAGIQPSRQGLLDLSPREAGRSRPPPESSKTAGLRAPGGLVIRDGLRAHAPQAFDRIGVRRPGSSRDISDLAGGMEHEPHRVFVRDRVRQPDGIPPELLESARIQHLAMNCNIREGWGFASVKKASSNQTH